MITRQQIFGAFSARVRPEAEQLLRLNVGADGEKLRRLLASKSSMELSTHDVNSVVEGNLWLLEPAAFRYYLPAFLAVVVESYSTVSVFASELVGALTEPTRSDVDDALSRVAQAPAGAGLPDDGQQLLQRQQREWFASGTPSAVFAERVAGLTPAEGATVLSFFDDLAGAHGADFPFDELELAVGRHWARYRKG